ncbi:MAG: putative amidohydrolase YtcJ, partial [Arenicella sp.]
ARHSFCHRKETITGTLETGKSADFIMLQENLLEIPLSRIREVLPVQTWCEDGWFIKDKIDYSPRLSYRLQ